MAYSKIFNPERGSRVASAEGEPADSDTLLGHGVPVRQAQGPIPTTTPPSDDCDAKVIHQHEEET